MKKRLILFVCLVMAITNIAFAATKPTLPAIDNACVGHTDYPDLVEIQDPASGIWFQVVLNEEDHTAKIVNRNFKWGSNDDDTYDFKPSVNGALCYVIYPYYTSQISEMTEDKLTIPSSFLYNGDNYNVVCIAEGVFASSEYAEGDVKIEIGKIEIPSTVKEVGDLSFYAYSGEIILNEGIEKIGEHAFRGSRNMPEMKLKKINFPKSLKYIGRFAICETNIQDIDLDGNFVSLGDYCFTQCYNLRTSKISAKNIGNYCFTQCTALAEVTLTADNVGNYCFAQCTALAEVTVTADNVGNYCFRQCTNLAKATIGAKVIGNYAFGFNTNLKMINLQDGVENIGQAAFYQVIADEIFIPKTVTNIDGTCFAGDVKLIKYDVDPDNTFCTASNGILLTKDMKSLIAFPGGRSDMLLPPSITSTQKNSFFSCPYLTKIAIPSKVSNIESNTFNSCKALQEVTFLCETKPTIVTSGTPSFNGCTGITSIKLRKSLKSSWDYTINGKAASTATLIPSVTDSYGTDEFIIVDGKAQLVATSKDVTSVVLPEAVTVSGVSYPVSRIGDYVFETSSKNCGANTREVIAFSDIDYIGVKAFGDGNVNFFMADRNGTDTDVDFATDIYELGATYNEFAGGGQKIYVKKSACSSYATVWGKYGSQFDYQIPTSDIMPTVQNGSFSREFAVDLSNDGANTASNPQLIAFVPMKLNKQSETEYTVRMQSINEGGAGDGTYIPAGTGVLLRKYGSTQPTYYEIAESQSEDENAMSKAVIINKGVIPASTASCFNFYISKTDGKAHKVAKETNIGVHKAYLSINVPSEAKTVYFAFDDFEATGILEAESCEEVAGDWYSLTGQKVLKPSKGIFIRNGKKYRFDL